MNHHFLGPWCNFPFLILLSMNSSVCIQLHFETFRMPFKLSFVYVSIKGLVHFVCSVEMEASHSVAGGWLLNWNAPTSGPAQPSPAQPSPARLNSPFSTGNDITLTGNGSQQLMENEWMWLWRIVLMEAFILKNVNPWPPLLCFKFFRF